MRMVKLGDVAKWGSGGTPKRSNPAHFGTDIPWVSIADLNDGLVLDTKEALTHAGLANSSAKLVPAGSLLVAMYGSIGKLGIAGRKLCTSQAIAFAIPDRTRIDTRYLFHFLLANRQRLQSLGRGGTQLNIGQGDLKSMEIDLPALEEQRRIAAILDKADTIRTKRRQVLAHLELAPFAAIESLLRDGVWDSRPLADLAEVWDCAHSTPVWTDSGKTCLRTSNLGRGFWDWTDTRYVSLDDFQIRQKGGGALPGDIILSREGTVGIGAMVQPGMTVAMGQRLVQVRAKSIDEHFLLWYLLYALDPIRISHVMVGATSKHLNVKDLRAMSIPTPGPDVQKQFANFATRLISEQEMVLQGIAQDDALFASLQSRAFKGEL